MALCLRRVVASLSTAIVAAGCVTLHTPLQPDSAYPKDWGEITALDPECKNVDGVYLNEGNITTEKGGLAPVLLTSVLNIRAAASDARTVSLNVHTRKRGRDEGAFVSLRVAPEGHTELAREIETCFCIKQTLTCGAVKHTGSAFPYLGFWGSQSNVYFGLATGRSLIVRLQNYGVGIVVVAPYFHMQEPWARFGPAN